MKIYSYNGNVFLARLVIAAIVLVIFWPLGLILGYLAWAAYRYNRVTVDKFGITRARGLLIPSLKFVPYKQINSVKQTPYALTILTSDVQNRIDLSAAYDIKAIALEMAKYRKK